MHPVNVTLAYWQAMLSSWCPQACAFVASEYFLLQKGHWMDCHRCTQCTCNNSVLWLEFCTWHCLWVYSFFQTGRSAWKGRYWEGRASQGMTTGIVEVVIKEVEVTGGEASAVGPIWMGSEVPTYSCISRGVVTSSASCCTAIFSTFSRGGLFRPPAATGCEGGAAGFREDTGFLGRFSRSVASVSLTASPTSCHPWPLRRSAICLR